MKRINLGSRMPTVVAAAAVIALVGAGTGYAAGQITSKDIQNDSVRSADIQDGTLKERDLDDALVKSLQGNEGLAGPAGPAGATGATGPRGLIGETGPAGPAGAAAEDGLVLDGTLSATATIANIGGGFVANSTQVGTLDLEAGTYVLNAYGFFDSLANVTTTGTQLMLAVRGPAVEGNAFGADYGTCFTGKLLTGNREATCQSVRTITLDEATTLRIIGFGYNEDGSGAGGGNFKVNADVSALKVG